MKKISILIVSIFVFFALTLSSATPAKILWKAKSNAPQQQETNIVTPAQNTQNSGVQTTIEHKETVTDSLQQRAEQGAVKPEVQTVSQINDIPNDYWAITEINACVQEGIMPLKENGNFDPDEVVRRVDFAQWVLNALENTSFQITVHNNYSDVNENTRGYETILRNDQLGLVYGYTDGEFKPERVITKAETNSIMSHITKSLEYTDSVLGNFTDVKDIPKWALHTYEKTVRYGLYVNNPNANEFLPNKQLNRAEAAVLLYKLRNALNLVKKVYKAERMLGVEHLDVTPLAPANTVQVTDKRLIVDAGNVLKIAFSNRFNSKNYNVGDEVYFFAKNDIKTVEGTLVFPAGTKFLATIETLNDPKWLNKNANLTIAFKNVTMPDGKVIDMNASAFENAGVLTSNRWEKPLFWTVGGLLTGTGIGLATGIPSGNVGLGLGIGVPAGAAAGAAIGFVSPGVNFGAEQGDEIYVLINEALSIYNCSGDDAE